FDENSGTVTKDNMGLTNATFSVSNTNWTIGKYGSGIRFNGLSTVATPINNISALTANLSLSAWIYPINRNYSDYYYGLMAPIIARLTSYANVNYAIQLTNATRISFIHRNLGDLIYEHFDLPYSVLYDWHHVAVSVSNNRVSLYLDGIYISSADASEDGGISPLPNQHFEIGGLSGYGFNGTIDEVRIYNKPLSSQEIYLLYTTQNNIYSSCCGDDLLLDNFYNGSIGSTAHFCQAGNYINQEIDTSSTLCNNYNYTWIDGSVSDQDYAEDFEGWDEGENIGGIISEGKGIWTAISGENVSFKCLTLDGSKVGHVIDNDTVIGVGSTLSFNSSDYRYMIPGDWISFKYKNGAMLYGSRPYFYMNGLTYIYLGYSNMYLMSNAGSTTQVITGLFDWLEVKMICVNDTAWKTSYRIYNNSYWSTWTDSPTYPVNSGTFSTTQVNSVHFGTKTTGTSEFYIDNFQVSWNHEYSCCGDDNNINLRNGLVSEWHFDEGEGITAYDNSNNNNGILTNMDTSDWVTGKYGSSLEFDGTNDYVMVSNLNDLGVIDKPYTISGWVKVNTGENQGNIIHISSTSNGQGWCLPFVSLVGNKLRAISWNNGLSSVTGATTLLSDVWYYFVTTWDLVNGLRIYVNGIIDGQVSQASYTASGSSDYLFVGFSPSACSGDVGWFNGSIDEVRIYNRALDNEEITYLYKLSPYSYNADNFYNSTSSCVKGSVCSDDIDYGFDAIYGTDDDSCGCTNEGTSCLVGQYYTHDGQCDTVCQPYAPLGIANFTISRLEYSNLYSNSLSEIKIILKNNGDGVGIINGINITGIDINSITYDSNIWPGQEGLISIKTFYPCSIEGIVNNFNFTITYTDSSLKTLISEEYEILTANPLSFVFLSNHDDYAVIQLNPANEERIQYFVKNNGFSNINLSATITQSNTVFSKVLTFDGEYYPSDINLMIFNLAPSSQLFFSNQLYPIMSGSSGEYSELLEDIDCEYNKLNLKYTFSIVSEASSAFNVMVADEKTLFEVIFDLIRQIFN
ncbi:MAG: LamG domain-containing protein, partial [Methanobacterium sp.]|nr:LamG domain-containing protein [Methanobacterium sp.]